MIGNEGESSHHLQPYLSSLHNMTMLDHRGTIFQKHLMLPDLKCASQTKSMLEDMVINAMPEFRWQIGGRPADRSTCCKDIPPF